MKKRGKIIVLSLGGSLIIPDRINLPFLKRFKKTIKKNLKKYRFVIVCGGGSIAREYITALKKQGINEKLQSMAGISATRMNARFLSYLFNQNPSNGIPHTKEEVKKSIKAKRLVFCGGLQYAPKQTSDGTAAQLASHLKSVFINLTNVSGLYDKNPKQFKNARFIPAISWKKFYQLASKLKYHPGQHFVLDQTAAQIIMKNKIPTYLLGPDTSQLDNLLNKRTFHGTTIKG